MPELDYLPEYQKTYIYVTQTRDKNVQYFSGYCANNVRHARTDAGTHEQPENIMPPAALS